MSHHESHHDDAHSTTAAPERDETGADWANTGGPAGAEGAGSTGGWSSGGRWSGANASATAQGWLTELQAIIDNLATQSAPVVREVGAKAAEIAALAAERAGPLAIRAADATAQATVRVAERSRNFAAELRRPTAESGGGRPSGADRWADDGGTGAKGPESERNEDTTAPTGPTV